jgi:CubicO group peptidase (beta-lactamase class C family)
VRIVHRSGLAVVLLLLAVAAKPVHAQGAAPFDAVAAEVRRGIARGLYPGGVIVVGRHDAVLYARGLGHFTWSTGSPVPDPATSEWDLASLTKVVATAAAWDSLLVVPLLTMPGFLTRYSDLNAMLLGRVLEQVAGEPLDRLSARLVFGPLGMTHTGFGPTALSRRVVVPSQMLGGRPVIGSPSDPNAAFMGGVAGHAGLFATGMDLARFAQMWLNEGVVSGRPFLSPATVRAFLAPSALNGGRRLGWDVPDSTAHPSAFGHLADTAVVGHTGWTGTFLWLDPARDLFVVFLTNRSLEPRRRQSIVEMREVRARVSDAAIRASGGCDPGAPVVVAC